MRIGSFIGGKWVYPQSGRKVRNVNPADTADIVREFHSDGEPETNAAIEAAERAFHAWRDVPAPERGRYIARVAEIAKARVDEIARTMTREEGKLLRESAGEVRKATGYGDREMAEEGLNFFTQTKTLFINHGGTGERAIIR